MRGEGVAGSILGLGDNANAPGCADPHPLNRGEQGCPRTDRHRAPSPGNDGLALHLDADPHPLNRGGHGCPRTCWHRASSPGNDGLAPHHPFRVTGCRRSRAIRIPSLRPIHEARP